MENVNNLKTMRGKFKAFSDKNNSICIIPDGKEQEEWLYISSSNKALKDFVNMVYSTWKGNTIKLILEDDRIIAIDLLELPEVEKKTVNQVYRKDIDILDIMFKCQWVAVEMLKNREYEDITQFLDDLILLRNKLVADIISTYTKKNGN